MHQSPPLTLSTDLNESAQSWADHQLDSGIMQHSGSGVGAILYCMSSSAWINLTGSVRLSVRVSVRVRVRVSVRVSVSVSTLGCSKILDSLQALWSIFSCFSASGKKAVEMWYGEVKELPWVQRQHRKSPMDNC